MNISHKITALFLSPILATVLCLASFPILSDDSNYTPVQPEFLSLIDQLSLFTMEGYQDTPVADIRDVFRHEWTLASGDLSPYPDPQDKPEAPLVRVTMIVDAGPGSFCIIDGKKMRPGDRTDNFKVTAIGKDSVTITHTNGTRETHHVKAY